MPKIVDHDKQREALLDASFRMFAEQGYDASTMRRLAAAAGVSTGALYHYFPDKPSILAAMFELLTRRDIARIQNRLPVDAAVPARIAALFAFLRENTEYLRALLSLALEVHRHEPGDTSRVHVQGALRRYRDALSEILGVDGTLAEMAFLFLLGSLTYGTLDPEGVDLDKAERFVQALWASFPQAHAAPVAAPALADAMG